MFHIYSIVNKTSVTIYAYLIIIKFWHTVSLLLNNSKTIFNITDEIHNVYNIYDKQNFCRNIYLFNRYYILAYYYY